MFLWSTIDIIYIGCGPCQFYNKNIFRKGVRTVSNGNNDNEILFNMIQDNFNHLRADFNSRLDRFDRRFDKIEGQLNDYVSKENCKKNRENCLRNLEISKSEISIKKVTAIGGVVTGVISASAIIIVTVLKIFYHI